MPGNGVDAAFIENHMRTCKLLPSVRCQLCALVRELETRTRERDDAKWAEKVVFDANRALDELTFDNQDPAISLEQRIRKAFAGRRPQTPEEMEVCAACTSDHNEFCTRHEDEK